MDCEMFALFGMQKKVNEGGAKIIVEENESIAKFSVAKRIITISSASFCSCFSPSLKWMKNILTRIITLFKPFSFEIQIKL